MHACSRFVLRADIIFIIYLYQRWIYRVDKSRGPGAQTAETAAATPASGSLQETPAAAAAAPAPAAAAAAAEGEEKKETAEKTAVGDTCTEETQGLRRRLQAAASSNTNA